MEDIYTSLGEIFQFIDSEILYDSRRAFAIIMGIISLTLLYRMYKDKSENWYKTLRYMFELAISALLFIRMY